MSVICGIISLGKDSISLEKSKNMIDKLKLYSFDYIDSWSRDKVFLGNAIQYITPESKLEKLPYYDKNNLLLITADAIIDNREELFNCFNITQENWSKTTDSDLILKSYIKWGKECPKYLVGDFAFAIWDENTKELFCARDHTGTRTFYYYYAKETFAFCTVIKPLVSLFDQVATLNEKWITDFLALPLTLHQCECCETIYESIHELPPATSITLNVNAKGITKNKFWDPIKDVKPLKLKDDKSYEEAFRKVFFEAVKCRLRCIGEVGIKLSGGMDSGSVACAAAIELAKKNKKLKAFSSIPIKEYKNKLPSYNIMDESEYIESIGNKYKNIELNYCRSEGQNSLTNMDYIIDVIEQPHKIVENMVWCNGIIEKASKQNCKVILNGQFGNYTISYGDFPTSMLTLFREGRLVKSIKEINGYGKIHKIPRKRITKALLKVITPYNFRKFLSLKIYRNACEFDSNLVNKELAKKHDIKRRYAKCGFYIEVEKYYDYKESKEFSVDPFVFSQIGAMETKLGLAHGIVERDPTRDKRVIEFCFSLPLDQFVCEGVDRRMIRRGMEGILPDKIRLNNSNRGLQSADWIQRLEADWKDIYKKLQGLLDNKELINYIDIDKFANDLLLVGENFDEDHPEAIRRLMVVLIFSQFLKTQI